MRVLLIFLAFWLNLHSEQIINGDIFIIKVAQQKAGNLSVNGKKFTWYDTPNGEKIAIIASNYHNKKDFLVKNTHKNGKTDEILLKAIQGDYKKEALSVEKAKILPPKSVQERIKKEYEEAVAIYAKSTPKLLFDTEFIIPLNSKITSNFGNARTFNGAVKSYHSGTDFRASIGTKIPASNDGIVKIAKDRYYAGGSIIIDHGAGIYSQYYHLSKIYVLPGEKVKKGDIIALSGDSGRVSGPHLHFGIAINGTSVNPLSFVNKINKALFSNPISSNLDKNSQSSNFTAQNDENLDQISSLNSNKISYSQDGLPLLNLY